MKAGSNLSGIPGQFFAEINTMMQQELKEEIAQSSLTIFISYSRSDADFAGRLVSALELRGQKILIDHRDIPFGEGLQREILDFIHQSDAVVFIVSPEAIRSSWCNWELEQVRQASKRLVPIVFRPVEPNMLSAHIRELNLLPFDASTDFDSQLDLLTGILGRDGLWLKEHTRLALAASRWSRKVTSTGDRSEDALLRGRELDEAELWISRHPNRAPEPTDLQRSFIQASRKASQARLTDENRQIQRMRRFQRWATWALAAIAVLVLCVFVGAAVQSRLTFTRESNVFAQLADEAFRQENYDRALRYGVNGLPPRYGSVPMLMPTSPDVSAQLLLSAVLSPLDLQLTGHSKPLSAAAYDAEGQQIVTASGDFTALIWSVSTGKTLRVLKGHKKWVRQAVFSPDGKRVLTGSDDGTARLWEVKTGRQLFVLSGSKLGDWPIRAASFSKDGSRIVTAAAMVARVWDASTGKLIVELAGHQEDVWVAAFSPDGSQVVTSCANIAIVRDTRVRVWNATTGQLIAQFMGQGFTTQSAVFSPNGANILTGSGDGIARMSDASTGKTLVELQGHKGPIPVAAFDSTGRLVLTGSFDGTARIWDARTGLLIRELKGGHADLVTTVEFSQDTRLVLTASPDGTAIVWNAGDGTIVQRLKGHDGIILSASFSPNGRHVLTASADATARVWEARPRAVKGVFPTGDDGPSFGLLSPNGTQLLTLSATKRARLWLVETATMVKEFEGSASPNKNFAAFGEDGRRLLFNTVYGTGRVMDAETHATLYEIGDRNDPLTQAVFSPDGTVISSGSEQGVAQIWDATTGAPLRKISAIEGRVSAVAFSPDSSLVAIASGNVVEIFNSRLEKPVSVLRGHNAPVWRVTFGRDGRNILTASSDSSARLWDGQTGGEICRTNGHRGFVANATFSSDETHFVTSSWDATSKVWNTGDCALLRDFSGFPGIVADAQFSRDGTIVAIASGDMSNMTDLRQNAVRLWNVQSGKNVAELRGHTQPVLSVSLNADDTLLTTTSRDGTVRIWNVGVATQWHGADLAERVCRERLAGTQDFTRIELQQPVLTDVDHHNPCERNGPLSWRYWQSTFAIFR
ncbi:TIR domain-containing protein [Rhizobium laguerreae]|uniref:TIR domain-containing protein n=1 Tax=Rhizobium laguerreae TaxID=1076926 RepID=UPI001C92809F|nr:TIR domain-containing protein [Rhizobium laguerreae]MBY3252170.1 TIR domain-containing protein [Rhizobium laguerreae]